MLYRRMGSLDWNVSILGFGAMRLPVKASWADIDIEKATEMIRYAIDHGVNYIDTAYIYHEEQGEYLVGKALLNGYREKVKLVTKSPLHLVNNAHDFHHILNTQLKKLQTDFIDIYLFHGINGNLWEKIKKLNLLKEIEALKQQGKIKHIGFSFHGSLNDFKEILDAYPWDVVQIQYNYLDTNFQASVNGLDYACSKKIAVVIMEPLRGGKLTQEIPSIKQIMQQSKTQKSLPELGLRYIWNHPGISVVLSGMSTLQQVQDNIQYANNGLSNSLTQSELELIARLKDQYTSKIKVPCTNCAYCLPCPQEVNIPENFNLLNHVSMAGQMEAWIQQFYNNLVGKNEPTDWHRTGKASRCVQCGLCLEKCPQKIDIPTNLEIVRQVFEDGKEFKNFL